MKEFSTFTHLMDNIMFFSHKIYVRAKLNCICFLFYFPNRLFNINKSNCISTKDYIVKTCETYSVSDEVEQDFPELRPRPEIHRRWSKDLPISVKFWGFEGELFITLQLFCTSYINYGLNNGEHVPGWDNFRDFWHQVPQIIALKWNIW